MKKGLLILSYNVNELNWEQTVWGMSPDKPGRLVKAAAVMLEENPAIAIITGGMGFRDNKSEAQWMKDRLYEGLDQLPKFGKIYPVFRVAKFLGMKERLDKVLRLEETARNTAENMAKTGKMFREAGVTNVIIVTSPDHISRALRDALIYWEKDYPELAANVSATPSVTLYTQNDGKTPPERASIANVVVAEPRAPVVPIFQRLFGINGNPEALDDIDIVLRIVLRRYGK